MLPPTCVRSALRAGIVGVHPTPATFDGCSEAVSMSILERLHPQSLSRDAESALSCRDGRRRSSQMAEWDFTLRGRRIELKSAMLCFNNSKQFWNITFHGVKLMQNRCQHSQPFDDLYLLIYTPAEFYLIRHDLQTGVTSTGVATAPTGHAIRVNGQVGQAAWNTAMKTILDKMLLSGSCELVSKVARTDPMVSTLYSALLQKARQLQDKVYEGIPMNTMSTSARGNRIQRIALEFDKVNHTGSTFTDASGEPTAHHCMRRSISNAAVDWIRDGVRVEVKSAKVVFDSNLRRWQCIFRKIQDRSKLSFHELWLGMYSPSGLDVFNHTSFRSGLSSAGLPSADAGRRLCLPASRQDTCVEAAVQRMKAKLEAAGATPLFTLPWLMRYTSQNAEWLAKAGLLARHPEIPTMHRVRLLDNRDNAVTLWFELALDMVSTPCKICLYWLTLSRVALLQHLPCRNQERGFFVAGDTSFSFNKLADSEKGAKWPRPKLGCAQPAHWGRLVHRMPAAVVFAQPAALRPRRTGNAWNAHLARGVRRVQQSVRNVPRGDGATLVRGIALLVLLEPISSRVTRPASPAHIASGASSHPLPGLHEDTADCEPLGSGTWSTLRVQHLYDENLRDGTGEDRWFEIRPRELARDPWVLAAREDWLQA
ncbi:unnamed protein product [Symbiodinium sp. KB8]|nr:unnamed protein product [Symbiodinium sp. KB8]